MTVYYIFHVLGFLCVLLFNIYYGKKYQIKPWKSIVTTLIVYSITYVWIYILSWAESGFKAFGGNNIVRGYIYIPLIAFPVAKLLKIKWKNMCDFIAPCVCISQGISHFGCIFAGCCEGYPCAFGIYNPYVKDVLFPIQIFESLTGLTIVMLVFYRAYKQQFKVDGLSYPFMLILYGFTRFFWEFGRNNEKILWGCSSLAFHALFMGICGVICVIILKKKMTKNNKKTKKKLRGKKA